MIYILLLLWQIISHAGIYSDIPKKFTKNNTHLKEIKFGYNLTTNLSQKQSLFFIEGNLKNDHLNHFSRYEISTAKTESDGIVSAKTKSNLFRTNTILPVKDINTKLGEMTISNMIYARNYNFEDRMNDDNNLNDTLATIGFGISRTNIYTIGLSVGRRKADLFFNDGTERGYVDDYIYRPSVVYTNKIKNLIPSVIKATLKKNSIYDIITSETTLKAEYALISGQNTYIQQLYLGVEKSIAKHIIISVFYDYEYTKSTHSTFSNINKIEKISTSLVIKI